ESVLRSHLSLPFISERTRKGFFKSAEHCGDVETSTGLRRRRHLLPLDGAHEHLIGLSISPNFSPMWCPYGSLVQQAIESTDRPPGRLHALYGGSFGHVLCGSGQIRLYLVGRSSSQHDTGR